MSTFTNPIIPGFYSDPSCIRVGDVFYMANSSFQFFPGIPIHKSKDLINWELIGNAINRPSQISLNQATTKITTHRAENYSRVAYTPRPFDLSDPNSYSKLIYFDFHGIDLSLFFDKNGKVYVQGSWIYGYDQNPATVIRQAEIDVATGQLLTGARDIWSGATGKVPEGPHVYYKDGWYYLLIAEGGTHARHKITMARSRSIWGPFESDLANPVLTAEGSSGVVQCVGHGDLVYDKDGQWWCVMLARREYGNFYPLGRETFLTSVEWVDGEFPVFKDVKIKQRTKRQVARKTDTKWPVGVHLKSIILILSGTYTEQLNITQPGPLTLLGESNSPHNASTNSVHVRWVAATEQGIYTDNVYTSVLIVAPTLNASLTGSGPEGLAVPDGTPFGCSDFRTYNIDFRNVYAEQSAGPANALSFSRANGGFYYSGFYSYQDTVYVGKLGNAYFHSSIVAKQTDFLYGFGTAWLELCDLVLQGYGGGITAWKGTNMTYPNKFGVYVHASSINAANASVVVEQKGRCALGRPWNSGHRSIFAETYEDGTIQDSGYVLWQAPITEQTLMGVYENIGPGWNVGARREYIYSVILDKETWEECNSPAKVFLTEEGTPGNVQWIDQRIRWW
ncbi:beta-xylosidase [Aspergillus flavus]|uniref:Beta-xylosidase n=1 Tax=Aspergillus flavus (strain ATCC 200026 / FGSC A1120 / IAM 13836 / NRRL 3357 / JCM 12722 / SRRC 167) TaxID=332952 RepID=A0A7U2QUK1_ASPFN|nr:beta-xylosidase [Aspergillus flavus]